VRRVLHLLPALLGALAAACPVSVRYADCQAGPVDLRSDESHCGGCHRACPEGVSCVAGVCAVPEGATICRLPYTEETLEGDHLDEDPNAPLGPGDETWQAHYGTVRSFAADLASDPANCGQCGRVCPADASCVQGSCRCPVGLTLCSSPPGPFSDRPPVEVDERSWMLDRIGAEIVYSCVEGGCAGEDAP
jgi:ferredoxin